MLNHSDDNETRERPEISRLLERLAQESRQWAEAEVTLAQVELAQLKAQVLRAALFAGLGFAAMLCAVVALTLAATDALSRHVMAPGLAALAVAVALALAAAAFAMMARRAVSWHSESLFFRWLGSRPGPGAAP